MHPTLATGYQRLPYLAGTQGSNNLQCGVSTEPAQGSFNKSHSVFNPSSQKSLSFPGQQLLLLPSLALQAERIVHLPLAPDHHSLALRAK
jgi:hypothetical protein